MNPPRRQSRRRVLLALENVALAREQHHEALRNCIRLNAPLDILMVHPPGYPPGMPTALMLHLEHSGVDYRFARVSGVLSEEVQRYLQRGRQPSTVIVAKASRLTANCIAAIRSGDHHLVDLSSAPLDNTITETKPAPVDLPANQAGWQPT
jgi:hypothetical protein